MDRPVAAIDVGTNTVLLLIAGMDHIGSLSPLVDVHRVPNWASPRARNLKLFLKPLTHYRKTISFFTEVTPPAVTLQRYTPLASPLASKRTV